ncbi:MAG TPA: NAD(P)H-binding protein [Solirubrobacteraceae bacterium]|jgi:putative NADH-flavin reductase|nr:NAD(P)H-binding protein [Solirubrobacteraceae bacterium]
MSQVTVLGATGYTGSRIVAELLRREHQVVALARGAGELEAAPALTVLVGSVYEPGVISRASAGSEVIVSALRGVTADGHQLIEVLQELLSVAGAEGARLGVMGGAGSLQTTPGGPLLVETPDFPAAAKPESTAQRAVLDALRGTDADVDWFYVSPGASYGQDRTPHRTGEFRIGNDVLLVDADGRSTISAEDLAVAVVNEIERPAHHRERFTVSY